MEGCQHREHLYAHHISVCLNMSVCPIHPLALYICMFLHTICSPYVMGTCGGHLYTHMSWGLWGALIHLSGILVSVSTFHLPLTS